MIAQTQPCDHYIRIPAWTGFIINQSASTFALGNDVMQIVEALIDVYRRPETCGIDFCNADRLRARTTSDNETKTNGFTATIPSLASGRMQLRSQTTGNFNRARNLWYGLRYGLVAPHLSLTLAAMNTVLYEKLLRKHMWPHLEQFSDYRGPPLDDQTLVVYLRSDDARNRMGKWFPEWKPHKAASGCSFFHRCLLHREWKRLVVVTRVADAPDEHPMLTHLRSTYGDRLRIQSGSLSEDFATLVHARTSAPTLARFQWLPRCERAAQCLLLPRLFARHDLDPYDDIGWTLPATAHRTVYVVHPSANASSCPPPVAKPLSTAMDESIDSLVRDADCMSWVTGKARLQGKSLANVSDFCSKHHDKGGGDRRPKWHGEAGDEPDAKCEI